jgi:hypothetical protein
MKINEIPGTIGFRASADGDIFEPSGEKAEVYVNSEGYHRVSVKLDSGLWSTMGVHRLVALTFIPCDDDVSELVVNHRNGKRGDNRVGNLEWTTTELNNIHAALLSASSRKPTIIGSHGNGEERFFKSIHDVARDFNCRIEDVWDNIQFRTQREGWLFRHHSFNGKIPKKLHKPKHIGLLRNNGVRQKREVDVKNIYTNEIWYFKSLKDAADHFGVRPNHIFNSLSVNGKKKVFLGEYQIVAKGERFLEISADEVRKLTTQRGYPVLSFNLRENLFVVWKSGAEFYKTKQLSKKAVMSVLAANKLREVDGWYFIYSTIENRAKLKDLIDNLRSNENSKVIVQDALGG